MDAMHDADGAIKQLQASVQAHPQEPNLHFALGYLLWTKSEWAEAAQEFQAELQHNPQNVNAQIYLADSQVQQSDFTTPLAQLQTIVVTHPSEPLVHLDLGLINARNGHTDEAVRELRTAAEQDPESGYVQLRAAKQLELLGRSEDAKVARDRASHLPQEGRRSLLELLEFSEL